MKTHILKTDPEIFDLERSGEKPYMFRKDDRNYEVGDTIVSRRTKFSGTDMAKGTPLIYTGAVMVVEITHILHGPFYTLPEDSCIITFKEI